MQNSVSELHELYPTFVSNEGVANRIERRLRPESGSTFVVTTGDQPVIRFNFPTDRLVNLSEIKLKFSALITGGTTPSFENFIPSIFARARIYMNGANQEWVNLSNKNLFDNIQYQAKGAANNMAVFLGVDSQANRRTYASAGRAYMTKPLAQIAPDSFLPLPLARGYLSVEFYPANPNTCVESAAAITSYTLSNVGLIYDAVIPTQDYLDRLVQMAAAGDLKYNFLSWDYTNRPCAGTQNDLNIPSNAKSVRALYAVQRLSSATSTIATNDKLSTWGFNTTTQYQFKLNGNSFPQDPVVIDANGVEGIMGVLKTVNDSDELDLWTLDTQLTYANYVSGKFIICAQFDKAQNSDSFFSGVDMSNSTGVDINIQMAATSNNTLDVFLVKDVFVSLDASGNFNVIS